MSYSPDTTCGAARATAERIGDRVALIENGKSWTFAEVYRDAREAASAFLARGIKKGDVVGVWAPNCREWIIATLGVHMTGAAITPLNTRLKGREAGDILRRSRTKILVCTEKFLGFDFPSMIKDEDLPDLKELVVIDREGNGGWDAFIASGKGADDPAVDEAESKVTPDDLSDIMFTSGTTGSPKGVLHTHGSVVPNFRSWANRVGLREGDRYLIVNPFFHTFGYKAGWVCALSMGATILPMAVFDVESLATIIERDKVSFIPGPPTIYQSLLAGLAGQKRDFSSLRVAVTGAAPVPPVLVERMRGELGMENVVNGYGMTECGAIAMTCQGDSAETVANTCGKALDGLELRCVDDDGKDVPAGTAGEILVRGPWVMKGYLDDPKSTAETIDADGWLHTGDVGTLDENGYLRITDRKKDMYISGGFNCYPAEIEKLLSAHPAIEVAAVIGVPDERMGEVGKAFVVLRPGAKAETADIIGWARENMANYKVPRFVEFVSDLPRNAGGKVLRMALRETAA
ncbi:MAG TPA: FadD3 family acyl-CoA ligase [Pedomonas sp.]|uniref:FadD3 family acyl-CoA ligase n=1 Tax=Pedomonas sp. TaxID=2976421 RepID=UPI002F4122F2